MDIADFLAADRVFLDLRLRDKPALLRDLARRASASSLPAEAIETALAGREELGSTGLGRGFALPHARIDGLSRPFGLFARLARPMDYAAIDEQPVDLVFLLLMPAQEKNANGGSPVNALAAVARRFREGDTAARLRRAPDAAAAFAILAKG